MAALQARRFTHEAARHPSQQGQARKNKIATADLVIGLCMGAPRGSPSRGRQDGAHATTCRHHECAQAGRWQQHAVPQPALKQKQHARRVMAKAACSLHAACSRPVVVLVPCVATALRKEPRAARPRAC